MWCGCMIMMRCVLLCSSVGKGKMLLHGEDSLTVIMTEHSIRSAVLVSQRSVMAESYQHLMQYRSSGLGDECSHSHIRKGISERSA